MSALKESNKWHKYKCVENLIQKKVLKIKNIFTTMWNIKEGWMTDRKSQNKKNLHVEQEDPWNSIQIVLIQLTDGYYLSYDNSAKLFPIQKPS